VADPGAAQGGEVGAGTQVLCDVGDEGSDVGSAAAGDLEGGAPRRRVGPDERQGVDDHLTSFALNAHAATVELVEAGAFAFEGGGHRRNLADVACKFPKGGPQVALAGHSGVDAGYVALGVKRVGDGAETGGSGVDLAQGGEVAGEAGCAADQDHHEPRGHRVKGAGVPNLGLLREEAFDLRDRARTRETWRLVEEKGAYWGALGYRAPPRSRRSARIPSSSSFASWGRMPRLV
jgi:hypothetical protein